MIYLIFLFSFLPGYAYGAYDTFFPTVISTERLMLFSFVIIVALEAWIFAKRLPGLSARRYIYTSIRANLVTIFIVVPIVWSAFFYLFTNLPDFLVPLFRYDFFASQFISLLAIDKSSLLRGEWQMVLIYFIVSYYVEYFFCYETFAKFNSSAVKKAFLLANLCSYFMIMIFETIYLTLNSPIEFSLW